MKLADLKINDIIYICKRKNGYQYMFKCKYKGLKKGRILGEIISVKPIWAKEIYRTKKNNL